MITITNAFSINMLDPHQRMQHLTMDPTSIEKARSLLDRGFTSAVGHADTAALFGVLLGVEVPMNRTNVRVTPENLLLVGQYPGPRLPEGATTLPDGATVNWWTVSIEPRD